MIARTWRGTASTERAGDYHHHFVSNVVPHLQDIPGFRGAYLLRGEAQGRVEFTALTFWESMETIKAFAGADPAVAVVEPEARSVLISFDQRANHAEVAFMQPELD